MTSTLWHNAKVATPYGILSNCGLFVDEKGSIREIVESGRKPAGESVGEKIESRDLRGCLVLPGFIDVHVHGGGGFEMDSGTYEGLDGMSRFHASGGTTAFLATTRTAAPEHIEQVLAEASRAVETGVSGAELLGVHLEGPFLNEKRAGSQNKENLVPPDARLAERFLNAAGGCIRLVTLAPELAGGLETVSLFAAAGVTVSAGHTDATFAEMEEAIRHGVTHTTHHFNGMRPLHHREPGAAGAGLLLNSLTIELIADGIHVHPEIIRMVFLTKPISQICMITDAVLCAGLPDGEYGDVRMENGQIYLQDCSTLSGSSLTMIAAFRNTLHFTGLPLQRILPAFTSVPARQAGVDTRKGSLEAGKDADFIVVDEQLELLMTVVRGREVMNNGFLR